MTPRRPPGHCDIFAMTEHIIQLKRHSLLKISNSIPIAESELQYLVQHIRPNWGTHCANDEWYKAVAEKLKQPRQSK